MPVKKLRVLALVHDHLVPPEDTTGIDILEAEWKMEYDVIETLREIGHEVREKGGMAYYAASALDGGQGPGPWRAYAGVNPKNLDRAVELILREIRKFTSRKVSAEELAENKTFFLGRLPLSLETNEGVAGSISTLELYNLGLDYLQRYPALVAAVTRDDIIDVAREFWSPERYVLAIAGPE